MMWVNKLLSQKNEIVVNIHYLEEDCIGYCIECDNFIAIYFAVCLTSGFVSHVYTYSKHLSVQSFLRAVSTDQILRHSNTHSPPRPPSASVPSYEHSWQSD